MSIPQVNSDQTRSDQTKSSQPDNRFGLSIVSLFLYSFCCIFVIGSILTIIKYAMAGTALSKGDTAMAAAILTDGYYSRPYGHPYYHRPTWDVSTPYGRIVKP